MARKILLQVGLVLCLGVYEIFGTESFLYLYKARNWDWNDEYILVHKDQPDLSNVDFDDRAHSYSLHATAIFYEYKNYNTDNPEGNVITGSYFADDMLQGTDPQLPLTSSVRILGYDTGIINNITHNPSITLFEKNNFGGLRKELITESKETLNYTNSSSLVLIGVYSWTFYDEINYGGHGNCVKGGNNATDVRFLRNSYAIGFSLVGKRSVEKGCWARHGVHMED